MSLRDYIMKYLRNSFKFESNPFIINTLNNFLDYAIDHFNDTENLLACYLSDIVDGLEFEDIKEVISNYDKYVERNKKDKKIVNFEKNKFNIPIINKIENAINNDELYSYDDDMKVKYIMLNGEDKSKNYAVVELDYYKLVMVNLENMQMWDILDYSYTVDDDILADLESGSSIAYMSLDTHYSIWQEVHYDYPEDINHKDGLQIYLQYCKDKQIDMDLLNEVMDAEDFEENLCDFVSNKDANLEI